MGWGLCVVCFGLVLGWFLIACGDFDEFGVEVGVLGVVFVFGVCGFCRLGLVVVVLIWGWLCWIWFWVM